MEFILEVWDNLNLDDGPTYVKVNINSKRLSKLKEYAEIVKSTGVCAVVDWDNSTKWFNDDDLNNEAKMDAKTVHIYSYGIHYEAYVKHTGILFISEDLDFETLDTENLDEEGIDSETEEACTPTDTNTSIKEE